MFKCCAFLLVAAAPACADIVYDNITFNSNQSTFYVEDQIADDTILTTGGTLSSINFLTRRNSALAGAYNGTATLRLYSNASGVPGALIAFGSVPVLLTDDERHLVSLPLPAIALSPGTYWTSIQFTLSGIQVGAGILDGNHPTVGSSSSARARFQGGAWNVYFLPSSDMEFRINTVPTPGFAAAVLALPGVVFRRRR